MTQFLDFLQEPSYWPSFIIALIVIGIFLFRIIRIFFREGVIAHIKDDWTYRLPYRIRHNRYRGLSRPSFVLLCLLYYPIKAFFLLIFAVEFYAVKLIVWDIWKWLFRFEDRDWYKQVFYSVFFDTYEDEYEGEENDDDAYEI